MQIPVEKRFFELFNATPDVIVRSPGRVNLIGEHTDYNEGFVLPVAIDKEVRIALRARTDQTVNVYSLEFGKFATFSLDDLEQKTGWAEYIKGVAHELLQAGYAIQGWDGVMSGNVPLGAGLSSSAAVEMAAARAFIAAANSQWKPKEMAVLGQRCERNWVGVNSGIMDQMVSAVAQAGHALFLDCRTLQYKHVPVPEGVQIIILDTNTRRGLVDSAYNLRRAQCEQAAQVLGVPALRDAALKELQAAKENMDEVVYRRARHVITENARVLEAVQAMQAGDAKRLGLLFNESHYSLRDDFEVTNDALNWIVDIAQAQSSCFGARMTGAGFGGCAVALIPTDQAEAFVQVVESAYRLKSGLDAKIYISHACAGTSIVLS